MGRLLAKFLPASTVVFVQEVPSGTVNGSNVTFTVSQTPASAGAFLLSLDGVIQAPTTDYTRSGVTITMGAAPVVGQKLLAYYI